MPTTINHFELFNQLLSRYGIRISPLIMDNLENIEMYQIEAFSEEEANRNHWDSRNENTISSLVMHYTVCNFLDTLKIFTKDIPDGRVSAHYVITQEEDIVLEQGDEQNPPVIIKIPGGVIFRVVHENDRAWHAGVSKWGDKSSVNFFSIGIELVNKGFVGDYTSPACQWFPFCDKQMNSAKLLMMDITNRYGILPKNVVSHGDIAPGRKQDAGILFNWGEVHNECGVGAWLTPEEATSTQVVEEYVPKEKLPLGISDAFVLSQLGEYGYPIPGNPSYLTEDNKPVLLAFRMHFLDNQYPENNISRDVTEQDMHYSWGLNTKYRPSI